MVTLKKGQKVILEEVNFCEPNFTPSLGETCTISAYDASDDTIQLEEHPVNSRGVQWFNASQFKDA